MPGLVRSALKANIHLGGGQGYVTPISRDVVYVSPTDGLGTVAGINVTADKAMSYIPFFAAIRLISEDLASLPLNIYRKRPDGGRDKDPDHPLQALLHDAPNPYMTSFSFREVLQSHVLTWGNGYAEIEYATDGSILALWPLRPDSMSVLLDSKTDTIFYRYALSSGQTKDLPARKVLHLHGLGFDGLTGYSVIAKARSAIGMALAGEKASTGYMERGTVPPAVLKHPKLLSQEARDNLRESWDSIDHRNRVAILEEGLDLQTIGIPPKDLAFVESAGLLRSMTATLFRLPPHMLSDVEKSTSWGTGIEQQAIGYVVHTLRPWIVRWEQQIGMQLLRGDDAFAKFTVDGLLRGDSTARWAAYQAGLQTGVYDIDEVREMEDRNPLPDKLGETRLVPLNTAPLAESEEDDTPAEMPLDQKIETLGVLVRAGFQPAGALSLLGLPSIPHTGLEPVTVTEQSKATKAREEAEREQFVEAIKTLAASFERGAAQRPIEVNIPPPQTTIERGAIQVDNHVAAAEPTPPAAVQVDVHVPEQKPKKKRVVRDKDGRIDGLVEE